MSNHKYGIDRNGKPMCTQAQVVKNWLIVNAGKGISQKECADLFGFTRLSAIIYVLKNKYGMPIKSEARQCPTRYQTNSFPTFYWIKKEDVRDYSKC